MTGKHDQRLLVTGDYKGVEEVSRRKEHLEANCWRGESKMRAVGQWKKMMKRRRRRRRTTTTTRPPFGSAKFLFFVKSVIVIVMEISVCNCDVTMHVMQQEQLRDIPVMWRAANYFFRNFLMLSFA